MLAKMKRRGLALFVAMVMVLGMLPTAALADELENGGTNMETIVLTPETTSPESTDEVDLPESTDEVDLPESTGEVTPPESTELPAPEAPAVVVPVEDVLENAIIETTTEDDAVITVSGLLPEGAYVEAYPVEVVLEDLTVLAAYDITIYDGEGNVWQPDESVTVDIQTPVLADVEEVEIYHMENVDADPEYVETITAESDVATFSAESFSIYVVTVTQNGHEVGKLTMTEGQSFSIRGHYSDWDHQWNIVRGNDVLEITSGRYNRTVQLKAVGSGTAIVQHTYYYWFWKQTECYEVRVEAKELEPTDTKVPVKFYVLDPERGAPTSGEDQGYKNYFPSSTNQNQKYNVYDGIPGTMTEAAWDALRGEDGRLVIYDEYTNPNGTALGLDDDWFALTNKDDALEAMYESFGISSEDAQYYELVWYVIKCQGGQGKSQGKDDNGKSADVHVDGYLKNVAVDVTYHSNFGTDETKVDDTAKTGPYTTWTYDTTGLPDRSGYTFLGWSEESGDDATVDYEAGESITLMSSLHLYAVWAETPKTGTLTVKKIVEGEATLPNDFKILVKSNGNTVYTLGLTANEGVIGPDADTNYTWTISNVTPGIYSIDEENALVDGYDLTSSANPAMVSVTAGNMSAVNVTNKYEDASDATASFTIKKVESGTTNGLAGAVFHICTVENCDGDDCNGSGWTVTTAAGGLATISGLESGTTYYMREIDAPEGYKLGNTVYKITVAGEHEKQTTGGNIFSYLWKLAASVFAGTDEHAASVVRDQQGNFLIPNEKISGELEITKKFSGIDELPSNFCMLVSDADDGEVVQALYVSDAKEGTDGHSYIWTLNLDEGSYIVEETGYAKAGYDISISVDEKTNVTTPRTTVVVTEDYTAKVSFVNAYTANTPAPIDPVEISFTGMKYLDDKHSDLPEFNFYLKQVNTENETVEDANEVKNFSTSLVPYGDVTNNEYGQITFPVQCFDAAGIYWYQVSEVISGDAFDYDTSIYYIKVVVVEENHQLKATPSYYKMVDGEAQSVDTVAFYNKTKSSIAPVEIPFTGMKYLDGKHVDLPAFNFYLKQVDTEGNTVDTAGEAKTYSASLVPGGRVTNNQNGQINFPTQRFDAAGTYWYQVSEVISDNKYDYDTSMFYIKVDVVEENGQLKARDSYYKLVDGVAEDAVTVEFYNETKGGGQTETPTISVEKTADKSSVRRGESLTYTITVTNESETVAATNVKIVDTLPNGYTVTSYDNGTVNGNTITWTIDELAAGATERFTITGTVDSDAAGTLTNSVAVTFAEDPNAAPTDEVATSVSSGTTPTPGTSDDGDDDDDDDDDRGNGGGGTVNIPDGNVPQGSQTDDGVTDIGGNDVPLGDAPSVPVTGAEDPVEITDDGVPMGNLPQTGTMATPANPTVTLGALAMSASLVAAGLAITISRKREEDFLD